MKNKIIGEGLQPGALSHGEISDRTVGPREHILPTGDPVHTSLQCFSRQIQRTSSVTMVGTRAGLKPMILDFRGGLWLELRIGQTFNRIAGRAPRLQTR